MKSKVLFWIGLLALIGVSCMDNIDQGNEKDRGSTGKDEITFNLSIEGSRINTYASVEPIDGEDHIYSLYLFFFDPSMGGTGSFLEVVDISPDKDESIPDKYIRSGDKISISSSDINIPLSEAYNILLLANARDYLAYYGGDDTGMWNEIFKAQGLTENDMKRLRFRLVPSYEKQDFVEGQDFVPPFPPQEVYESYDNEPLIEPETLIMSASVTKEADQDVLNADLIRIVSRFDVKNTDDNYTLKTVSIWNGFRMGTIASDALTDFSLPRIIRMYGLKVDEQASPNEIVGGLYSFENYVISPEQNDDQTTCLILGMENNLTNKISYYRLNVALPGRAQQLRRNNAYKISITRVKGVGEGSEKDAYNSSKKQIEFQINYWDQNNEGNIVYDGDNILAITSSMIAFLPEGGTYPMDIFTTGEGTLEILEDATPNGITATLEGSLLTVTATPSSDHKEGYIKLKFGKLEISIIVKQSGNYEQTLDVSHSALPVFPNTDGTVSETVTVTSSGTWSAKIYNNSGNIFLFEPMGIDEITGNDNTTFQIKTNLANSSMESRYAFVHIVLDENPDISRVIILSQNGSGTIDVKLNDINESFDGIIYFTADGFFDERRNVLNPKTEAILFVDIEGQGQASEPLWLAGFPNGPGNFSASEEIAKDQYHVKAAKNIYEQEQETILRVQSKANSGTYKLISLKQEAHTITYTPEGFRVISANGGESEEIKIKASAPFTVELISDDLDARFNDINGPIKLMHIPQNVDDEYSLKVVFPQLTDYSANPAVTVKMTINDTQVSKSFEIKQSLPVMQSIIFQSTSTTYGTLYHNTAYGTNYVGQLRKVIPDKSYFGPEGAVIVKDMQIKYKLNKALDETTILVPNMESSASNARKYKEWLLGSNKRVLLALQDGYASTFMNNMNFDDYESNAGVAGSIGNDYGRKINGVKRNGTKLTVDNNALYDYLFRSGPFTKNEETIDPDDIFLMPYDFVYNCLRRDRCPDTMIPLVMSEDKQFILLGVDPTNRFIFCGEMELFGNEAISATGRSAQANDGLNYNGKSNYSDSSPHGPINTKFLNNLIAWMINVNLYGEEFTKQFID